MKLYDSKGWLNVDSIFESDYPFTFIIGARGIGKTYGILKHIYEHKIKSIILRRTQVQADLISKAEFNPYKQLCTDNNWNITVFSVAKGITGLTDETEQCFGYIAALSTFANLRGFDASDIDCIFLDEFIPERGSQIMKNEYEKLLHAYETVNRNRELLGKKPVKLICAANSNTIDNPYFIGLGIVNKIASLQKKGKSVFKDDRRGLLVISLKNSPISYAKADTALYRLAQNSSFTDVSLNNVYEGIDEARIKHENVIEYRPLFTVGEITVYRHKSKVQYYVTTHRTGSPVTYTSSSDDIERCKQAYKLVLAVAFYDDRVIFEDGISQVLYRHYLL